MYKLVFANIPHDCREEELQRWVEERGFTVTNLRLIRDSVSSSSPAFARIQLTAVFEGSSPVETLNHQELRGRRLLVRSERTSSRP